MTAPLYSLTAVQCEAAYRSGALSPVDVIQSVAERITALEPKLHATWLFRPEQALQAAHASAARWHAGAPLSPLDGVPVTLKDNIATQGDPMPLGTAALPARPEPADAPIAARLQEDGAILIAKTTMPDFGMLSSGLSSFHALARNPWDLTRTPGGSSAGAGAAAAAGYGPLHVGTDIGGSLRLPASWCGIFTLKPSHGRIPLSAPYVGRCAGPMTRTVEDAARLMASLARPDARDYTALPPAAIAWGDATVTADFLRGKRVGLLMDAGCGLALEGDIRAAIEDAAQRIEAAGARVEAIAPFLTPAMLNGMDTFWQMRALQDLRQLPDAHRSRVLPYIAAWAQQAEGLSAEQLFVAHSQFAACAAATVAATHAYDFVISPVSPNLPAPAEYASPTNDPARSMAHIAFTVPYNMSGQPAASINCGYTPAGLPIGVQVAGRRFDDLGVLQFCRAFEHIRLPAQPWPDLG